MRPYYLLIVFGSMFLGCAGSAPNPQPKGDKNPDWYLRPGNFLKEEYGSDEKHIYGIGQATKEIAALAQTTADARAVGDIARTLAGQTSGLFKDHMEQAGVSGQDAGIAEFSQLTSELFANSVTVTGARIINREVLKDGKTYFSLAILSLDKAHELAEKVLSQAQNRYSGNAEALFSEKRARDAFQQLDAKRMSERIGPR